MKTFPLVLGLAIAMPSCAAVPPSAYSATPITGIIVDQQTKAPIEGVTVVAQWVLEGGMHIDRTGIFHVEEAVTDSGGRYRIAGWGPIPRMQSTGVLDGLDPEILIFKAGYEPLRVSNSKSSVPGRRVPLETRNSVWDGSTIVLEKNLDSERDYADRMSRFLGAFYGLFDSEDCKWKRIPMAAKAIESERMRESAAGARPSTNFHLEQLINSPKCQPIDEFLRQYEGR